MTAQDVKYSIEIVQEENADLELFHETIQSVKVIDDNTVEIITDGPDPVLLNKLTFLPIIDSQSEETDDPINGTGPYTLKPGTTPTEDEINLIAFDDYHGGHVYTRELLFAWQKTQKEAVANFNQGKLDIVGDLDKDSMEAIKNGQQYSSAQPGLHFLGINTTKTGPLQKLEVRQALQHLVDASELLENESTFGEPIDQLIPQDIPGHNPAISRYEHNVDKAKEFLASAGYPEGLTLNLISSAAPPGIIKELQRQYAEGGVTLEHKNIEDFGEFLDTAFGAGPELDLYYTGYGSDVLDGTDFLIYLIQDLDNYDQPKLDQYIKEVSETTNQEVRLEKMQEAAKFVHDQALVVPLFDTQSVFAFNKPYIVEQDTVVGLGAYFQKVYLK
jgi:peptide/nickel transport system substrate-binding protein